MKIADLKTPLTLQAKTRVADGAGGYTFTYTDIAQVYCHVMAAATRETLQAHKISASVTHRITLRYRDDVTTDMRLVDGGGQAFDIISVHDTQGEKRFLEILAIT